MMKTLLILLFATVSVCMHAQVGIFRKADIPYEIQRIIPYDIWDAIPDSALYMTIEDGGRLEFWGQKGIASAPLIETMEAERINLQEQLVFWEKIWDNCTVAKEEYRKSAERATVLYNNKANDYIKLQIESEAWEKKAKKRGAEIWAIRGIAATVATAFILSL